MQFDDMPPAPPLADEQAVDETPANMFELYIGDTNVQNGTVAVSWCVSPELLKDLAERGERDPQVVIVTATADTKRYDITKEYRVVVPLKDLMAYVEFRSAGPCNVWAFVNYDSYKDTKTRYLGREDGRFKTTILNSNGSDYGYCGYPYMSGYQAEPLNVEVPAGVFAPEPSDFEKAWVDYFFKSKCVDQCSFRRRRMLAYTVQVFPFLANMFVRFLLTFVALMIGSRGLSLNYILHPLTYELESCKDLFDGSIFIQRVPHRYFDPITLKYLAKKYWALPFMPVVMLMIGLLLWISFSMYTLFVIFVYLPLGSLVLVGLFFLSAKKLNKYLDERKDQLEKLPPWYLEKEEMDLIMCSNPNKPRTLADLPARKRTLRLHFQDLKSRVCRPFSV